LRELSDRRLSRRELVSRPSAYGHMERSEPLAGVSRRPSAGPDIDPRAGVIGVIPGYSPRATRRKGAWSCVVVQRHGDRAWVRLTMQTHGMRRLLATSMILGVLTLPPVALPACRLVRQDKPAPPPSAAPPPAPPPPPALQRLHGLRSASVVRLHSSSLILSTLRCVSRSALNSL
jgi:hypothetical protein